MEELVRVELRFVRAINNLTVDGYYTSEIRIHKDFQYKVNSYVKEFKGCTHPTIWAEQAALDCRVI
jgi:hypothetical protein